MERCNTHVGDVHRHLGHTILIDEPADGLCSLECAGNHDGVSVLILHGLAVDLSTLAHGATLLADVKRYGVGTTCRSGVEVEVDGNQEVACADSSRAGAGHSLVKGTVAEIGGLSLVVHLLGQSLVFTCTANGKVLALGCERGCLVAVCGYVEFFGNSFRELAGQFGALLKSNAAHRNEGANVGGTHAGVSAMVLAHVDKLGCLAHAAYSGIKNRLGLTYESNNRAVSSLARIDIEQAYFPTLLNLGCNRVDNGAVAALAEIGHAFNNLSHV